MGVRLLACALGAYLLGGIPLGLWAVRMRRPGVDLRALGSGNLGTSNIYRNVGGRLALVVGPLQFVQGLACLAVARSLGLSPASQWVVALAAVVGNGWPLLAGFNGGRGVAVATGAVAGLSPVGLCVLLVCYAAGALGGEIAVGVLAGFVVLVPVAAALQGTTSLFGALLLLALILLRRLEGVRADLDECPAAELVWARLVHDRRPGRPLVGPRTDHR